MSEQELLHDLQSRIAFQDAAIDELNLTVARQQQEIDGLHRALKELHSRLQELRSNVPGQAHGDEPPPPHY